jgi:hypothetical protein
MNYIYESVSSFLLLVSPTLKPAIVDSASVVPVASLHYPTPSISSLLLGPHSDPKSPSAPSLKFS